MAVHPGYNDVSFPESQISVSKLSLYLESLLSCMSIITLVIKGEGEGVGVSFFFWVVIIANLIKIFSPHCTK